MLLVHWAGCVFNHSFRVYGSRFLTLLTFSQEVSCVASTTGTYIDRHDFIKFLPWNIRLEQAPQSDRTPINLFLIPIETVGNISDKCLTWKLFLLRYLLIRNVVNPTPLNVHLRHGNKTGSKWHWWWLSQSVSRKLSLVRPLRFYIEHTVFQR